AVDHFGLASVYAHRARMELARREPQAAINFYEHALSLLRGFREPTRCAILLENIALVHSSRGNWSDAIEFQGRAVETAPTTYARRERMFELLKEMREILERSKQPWVRRHRIEVLGWGGFLLLLVLLVGGVLAVEGRYEAQVGSAIESIKSTALDSDAR